MSQPPFESSIFNRQSSILLVGPTGTGKTPLGEYLELHGLFARRCFHFDFGAQLRQVEAGQGSEYGLSHEEESVVRSVLRDGALLEDRHFVIAGKILGGFLRRRGVAPADRVVLNGLPRHAGQAEAVAAWLDVRLVVNLDCTAEVVRWRIATNAGGDRLGRGDDSPADVERKLAIFSRRTAPLLDHYRRMGVTIAVVPVGERTAPGDIVEILEREYGSTHGNHR